MASQPGDGGAVPRRHHDEGVDGKPHQIHHLETLLGARATHRSQRNCDELVVQLVGWNRRGECSPAHT